MKETLLECFQHNGKSLRDFDYMAYYLCKCCNVLANQNEVITITVMKNDVSHKNKNLYYHHECFKVISGISFTELKTQYYAIDKLTDNYVLLWETEWQEFTGL